MEDYKRFEDFKDAIQSIISNYNSNIAHFKTLWTIKDYLKVKDSVKHPDYISMKLPLTIFPDKFVCSIDVHPNGYGEENSVGTLYITNKNLEQIDTWIYYTVSILKADNTYQHCFSSDVPSLLNADYPNSDAVLLPEEDIQLFLTNGCLQILLKGIVWQEEPIEENFDLENFFKDSVSGAVASMCKSEDKADAILFFGKELFHIHKNIMASRSSVFQTLFQESSNNIIEVKDIAPEMFKELIHFLYTDTVTANVDSMLPEMLELANKHGLQFLKQICMFKIIENISENTAIRYLIVGHESNCKQLKEKCLDYIIENKKSVSKLESWKTFKSNHCRELVEEVLDRLMDLD